MTINKISLDFYFTNCTLESKTCKYWIKLNETNLEYCLIGLLKYNETSKIESRYELSTINKSFISSIDLYSDSEDENAFILKINISGRNDDIVIPFIDSEKAYEVYLQIKDWNENR